MCEVRKLARALRCPRGEFGLPYCWVGLGWMAGWVNIPVRMYIHPESLHVHTTIAARTQANALEPSFHHDARKARGVSKPRPRRPPATCSGEALPRSRCRCLAAMGASHALRTRAAEASPLYIRPARTRLPRGMAGAKTTCREPQRQPSSYLNRHRRRGWVCRRCMVSRGMTSCRW